MKILISLALFIFPLSSFSYTHDEVVASVIIREAGGEGNIGMQAVANVIYNRAAITNKSFFDTVIKPYQFESLNSAIVEKRTSLKAIVAKSKMHLRWNYALLLVRYMHNNALPDITHGATNFHNTKCKPYWSKKMRFTVKIFHHLFYRDKNFS